MPWTEIEINGQMQKVHFFPGDGYLSGKVSLADVQAEIVKAIQALDEGDFEMVDHDEDLNQERGASLDRANNSIEPDSQRTICAEDTSVSED